MDTNNLIHQNRETVNKIIEHNQQNRESRSNKISDQRDQVLHDSLKHMERHPPMNRRDAEKRCEEAKRYWKPDF